MGIRGKIAEAIPFPHIFKGHLRDFAQAMWGDWLARMSGPLSVPAVILALWLSNETAKTAFIVTAFICLWVTAYRIWKPEREQVQKLSDRLTPKFTAVFDSTKPPCRSVSEFRFSDDRNPRNGMVYRIEVENIGAETINNCEGYLTEVAFEDDAVELGVMNLLWSGMYPQALRVDLRPNVRRHLDLIVIYDDACVSIISPGWPPNNRQDFFLRRGHYRFTVVIGEDRSTLPPYKLRLDYTGDWQTSTMEVISCARGATRPTRS